MDAYLMLKIIFVRFNILNNLINNNKMQIFLDLTEALQVSSNPSGCSL